MRELFSVADSPVFSTPSGGKWLLLEDLLGAFFFFIFLLLLLLLLVVSDIDSVGVVCKLDLGSVSAILGSLSRLSILKIVSEMSFLLMSSLLGPTVVDCIDSVRSSPDVSPISIFPKPMWRLRKSLSLLVLLVLLSAVFLLLE